ncbi:MAG: aminotransferase class I/II-fold pyridoxal phosphate-dependent enzyme, partial [Bifidobacteriaceae bacterium]|nr:aminotransferase class I/II-fold pyridoxal phosphate-dependent enzyme [Bifidobacteriaceae bacterium]
DYPKQGFSIIPMWIADMNFTTSPTITKAIENRLQHGLFGYFQPRDEYFKSIIAWHKRHNKTTIKKEYIGYENGVLGGLISALHAVANPGDYVLLHSPTYVGFTHSIEDNGYHIIHSPLYRDAEGVWRMNYEDMDAKIKQYNIHVAVFCSPHNPSGRVWERDEIEKALKVYADNDCTVVSDEIWSDITLFGKQHIPTQSVNKDAKNRTIALYAPTKTFNIAGIVNSYHVIYNKTLRQKVESTAHKTYYNDLNVLSMYALIGAYSIESETWLEQLRQVLGDNVETMLSFLREEAPLVSAAKPDGTYMLLLDCSQYCERHGVDFQTLLKRGWEVGVIWQNGEHFYASQSIRLNLALPKPLLLEAIERLRKYVFVD